MSLPTYIPLPEAAKKYAVPAATLTRLVAHGKIDAVRINGGTAVAEEDVNIVAAQVQAEDKGDRLVSINEAARELGIHPSVVSTWQSYGWLPAKATGSRGAKLVSWRRAQELARLREKRGRRGQRLIPRDKEVAEALTQVE